MIINYNFIIYKAQWGRLILPDVGQMRAASIQTIHS